MQSFPFTELSFLQSFLFYRVFFYTDLSFIQSFLFAELCSLHSFLLGWTTRIGLTWNKKCEYFTSRYWSIDSTFEKETVLKQFFICGFHQAGKEAFVQAIDIIGNSSFYFPQNFTLDRQHLSRGLQRPTRQSVYVLLVPKRE